jgi:hypothetical protein
MKRLLLSLALMLLALPGFSHGVQCAYTVMPNGFIRVYIEHWHGDMTTASLQGNGMSITTTYGATTVTQNINPSGAINNTSVSSLPGQGDAFHILYECGGYANVYDDWAYYDFAPAACGVPVSITLNAGLTVVLQEACSDLWPRTITNTFYDNAGPIMNCPSPVASVPCGSTGTNVNFNVTAIDNCTQNPTITTSIPSGSFFPVGSTTVTATATDANNNVSTCSFQVVVNVVDNTPPVAVAHNATVTLGANGTATLSASAINNGSTDNCGSISSMSIAPSTFNCNNVSSPVPVVLTVKDPAGNTGTATAYVTVVDNTVPVITAPANVTEVSSHDGTGNCSTKVSLGAPTVTDNCGTTTTAAVNGNPINPATYAFPIGTSTVTWTARDGSGNTATATQSVTVIDNENPTITAPADVTVNADNGNCAAANVVLGTPVYADNCTGATVSNDAPASFSVGTTTVTWTVTDASNHTTQATQLVTVMDNQDPTIAAPANISVVADNGQCYATITDLGAPVTADNCAVEITRNDAPASGQYPVGTTTVTWTTTDIHNHSATATQTITVTDNQHPSITAPAAIVVNADQNSCDATNVVLGDALASDNCALASITNDAPAAFPKGTTVVTWTATDIHNNVSTATQNVTVEDHQNPTISAPATVNQTADNGKCYATITSLGTPTIADNCTGATVSNDAPANGQYAVGSTTVTWTVTDASNNSTTATQVVTVSDDQAPSITAPASVTVSTDANLCSASNVSLGTPVTSDNCDVASVNNNAPAVFPKGLTTVTWTVTDIHSHTSTATQTVTVEDRQAPAITAPANVTVNADNNSCAATAVVLGTPVFSDNCPGTSVTNNALASYPVGNTTVTWTAQDAAGNIKTAQQTVTVIDNQAPVVACKPYTLTLSGGAGTVAASDIELNPSTDNCGIASKTVSPNTFNCNNAGNTYPVTLTVTDIHGNISTCSTTVTVQYKPTVSTVAVTPGNTTYTGGIVTNIYLGYGPQTAGMNVTAGGGGTGYTYSWTPATALSNSTIANPVFMPTTAGSYTYHVTVTNNSGCPVMSAPVTFCVKDVRVPGQNGKIYICHAPNGNPANTQTLSISTNAVASHMSGDAGDRLGACDQTCGSSNARTIAGERNELGAEVKVYPNPNNGLFTVELPHVDDQAVITVSDVSGKTVQTKVIRDGEGNKIRLDLGDAARGMYFIEVSLGGEHFRTKVIVQ